MSDSEQNENSKSVSGGRRTKACGLCPKQEKEHWKRHWKQAHPGLKIFEKGYPNPNEMSVVPYEANQSQQGRQRNQQVLLRDGSDDFLARRPELPEELVEGSDPSKRQRVDDLIPEIDHQNDEHLGLDVVRAGQISNILPAPNDDQRHSQYLSCSKSIVNSSFLSELLGLSATKFLLKLRLTEKAEQFMDLATLRALRPGAYRWLEDALLELRANDLMKPESMLGLLIAMTALGEPSSVHIPIFMQGLSQEKIQKLVALYESNLTALYDNDEVCRWLAQHLSCFSDPTFRLAKHLSITHDSQAYDILEIQRVCTLPKSLDIFINVCRMILANDFKTWITECLKHCPMQEQVEPEALAEILLCITQVNQHDFLNRHKAMIVKQPVSIWLQIIAQLDQNKSELNTDNLQWQNVVDELVKLKGGLDATKLYELCKDPRSRSAIVLDQVKLKPNQFQEAIAGVSAIRSISCKRQLWQLSYSMGKSRIIHALASMLLCSKMTKIVHIVIPSKGLERRDKEDFKDYWIYGGNEKQVKYHTDINFTVKKDHIVLVDEADTIIFGEPLKLIKVMDKCTTILFTASCPDPQSQSLESKIFDQLGLDVADYWPSQLAKPTVARVAKALDVRSTDDLAEFIKKKAKLMAVLVYTSKESAQMLTFLIDDSEVLDAATDHDSLRQLHKWKNPTSFRVLIADSCEVMRGTDLRGSDRGLCLILDKGFQSQRDADQALMRVGRCGERSEKYLRKGVELVDPKLHQEFVRRLIDHEVQLSAEKNKSKVASFNVPLPRKNE